MYFLGLSFSHFHPTLLKLGAQQKGLLFEKGREGEKSLGRDERTDPYELDLTRLDLELKFNFKLIS
jgi:hypothetical protein